MSSLHERSSCKLRGVELSSGDASKRIQVAGAGRQDDGRGQARRRGFPIPLAPLAFAIEIVAQRLLVEAWLAAAWLVRVRRPETRAVGRQHLVDEQDASGGIAAEL